MIKKILSGGETGANKAAVDVALRLGIGHGDSASEAGKAGENTSPSEGTRWHRKVAETYELCIEQYVLEADGTIVLTDGDLTGAAFHARKMAMKYSKPWFHVNFQRTNAFQVSLQVDAWISEHRIETLHVAGPHDSHDTANYQASKDILEMVLYLDRFDIEIPKHIKFLNFSRQLDPFNLPRKVDEVIDLILSDLSLKDQVLLAGLGKNEIRNLDPRIQLYIKDEFHLGLGNDQLLDSCRITSGRPEMTADAAAGYILIRLWARIRKTHRLRVVQ